MTPKEKAQELVKKFEPVTECLFKSERIEFAEEFAILCVDEILNETGCGGCKSADRGYWLQVRQEIQFHLYNLL